MVGAVEGAVRASATGLSEEMGEAAPSQASGAQRFEAGPMGTQDALERDALAPDGESLRDRLSPRAGIDIAHVTELNGGGLPSRQAKPNNCEHLRTDRKGSQKLQNVLYTPMHPGADWAMGIKDPWADGSGGRTRIQRGGSVCAFRKGL